MSVQATFCATLVDEWVRLGVTDAVVCPGSLRRRSRSRWPSACGSMSVSTSAAPASSPSALPRPRPGRPSCAHQRHGLGRAARGGGRSRTTPVSHSSCARPIARPSCTTWARRRRSTSSGSSAWSTGWAVFAPAGPSQGQESSLATAGRPGLRRSDPGAPRQPGRAHLNLAFREPLIGSPAALPARQGPTVVFPDRGSAASRGPAFEPLQGRGIIIAGGRPARPAESSLLLSLAEQLGWPRPGGPALGSPGRRHDRRRRCHRPHGATAAGDRRPARACPGSPGRSAPTCPTPPRAGARVIVVDPWRRWADPTRVATEFHQWERRRLARCRAGDGVALRSRMARLVALARATGAGGHRPASSGAS